MLVVVEVSLRLANKSNLFLTVVRLGLQDLLSHSMVLGLSEVPYSSGHARGEWCRSNNV
jgi:hypothetical protein